MEQQMTLPTLAEAARVLGRPLTEEQLARFAHFRDVLLDWNAKINVTGIREPAAVETLHFVDALAGLAALPPAPGLSVIDVGSGGGLPGLALRLARPDLEVTLVDSIAKKVRVIEEIAQAIGLAGTPADGGPPVRCVAARAEDLGRARDHRERYDVALARAVAEVDVLAELVLPLVKPGGRAVLWKKRGVDDELARGRRAVEMLGGRLGEGGPVDLPGLAPDRQLVVVVKERATPPAYPRPPGVPQKKPL